MNIRLRIDRVVLDGFPMSRAETAGLKAALEGELSRLLSAGGVRGQYERAQVIPHLQAGAFAPPPGASPRTLGTHIARSVYGGIGKAR